MKLIPKLRRVVIVTDAWQPQVNGVVRTLANTKRELEMMGHWVQMITPNDFNTIACPGYPEIRLALATSKQVQNRILELRPDALHIATEGPLGWAARSAALRSGWSFTTAYHTRFPEYVHARIKIPLKWSYAALRKFHAHSTAVLAPTPSIINNLQTHEFQQVRHWGRGVDHQIFFPNSSRPKRPSSPIFLYAGRIAIEKNIQAFLDLDLPGEKWVVGDGPLAPGLRRNYRNVRWIGMASQYELADIYRQANVLVFPSKTDTFGLVMAEAMACGLPVAAYPVTGPIDVVGQSGAGALDHDLQSASLAALNIPTETVLAHAKNFSWAIATKQFSEALSPINIGESTNSLELATEGSS
jgi:glycosyltransferase involved in cell wall biosynthesis